MVPFVATTVVLFTHRDLCFNANAPHRPLLGTRYRRSVQNTQGHAYLCCCVHVLQETPLGLLKNGSIVRRFRGVVVYFRNKRKTRKAKKKSLRSVQVETILFA